jgi:hypothetical protein
LTSAVSSLPVLLEKKRLIDMHTTIATNILDQVRANHLLIKLGLLFNIDCLSTICIFAFYRLIFTASQVKFYNYISDQNEKVGRFLRDGGEDHVTRDARQISYAG